MGPVKPHSNRLVRLLCLVAGFTALGLGLAGILLPVLPTTPFILVAAACFARSSERFHTWLLSQPVAGPAIREWQEHRAMPRKAKRLAYLLMLLSFGTSILIMESVWHRLMLLAVGLVLGVFLARIPVREADTVDPPSSRQQ